MCDPKPWSGEQIHRTYHPYLRPLLYKPASGREIGEADDHDGGVERGCHGEEDGHGDVGRVVEEAGQGHGDCYMIQNSGVIIS